MKTPSVQFLWYPYFKSILPFWKSLCHFWQREMAKWQSCGKNNRPGVWWDSQQYITKTILNYFNITFSKIIIYEVFYFIRLLFCELFVSFAINNNEIQPHSYQPKCSDADYNYPSNLSCCQPSFTQIRLCVRKCKIESRGYLIYVFKRKRWFYQLKCLLRRISLPKRQFPDRIFSNRE